MHHNRQARRQRNSRWETAIAVLSFALASSIALIPVALAYWQQAAH
jgi:hypothetical protein